MECVTKLLKILTNTKHNKIRFNAICAIKNIMFYSNSNRDIKKTIMKKFTYDLLLSYLDDEDIAIQEQALLIFRVLLFKASEDIEEVFSHCSARLLPKVEEKLNSGNVDILIQSLYILCNISAGSEKHKSIFQNYGFMPKISNYLVIINNIGT
jgi:hypothetical protein